MAKINQNSPADNVSYQRTLSYYSIYVYINSFSLVSVVSLAKEITPINVSVSKLQEADNSI